MFLMYCQLIWWQLFKQSKNITIYLANNIINTEKIKKLFNVKFLINSCIITLNSNLFLRLQFKFHKFCLKKQMQRQQQQNQTKQTIPQTKKVVNKPILSSANKNGKKQLSQQPQQKLQKLQIYFKYRIASIYRQLKMPIYENLLNNNKNQKSITTNNKAKKQQLDVKSMIDILYKFINMNSKYHHREKIRFSRTALFKCIKYDFAALRDRLQSKKYCDQTYGDLEQSDNEVQQFKQKPQHFIVEHFSKQSISNYQKKNKIDGPIVISQGYEDLKSQLISKHGWSQNIDTTSLIYHLKFMSKKKDIDYVNLLDFQVVNHFEENKSITAKFGLCRNIQNLVYMGGDFNGFFPRCYDVNDVAQLENFYEDFKISEARRIINDFSRLKGIIKVDLNNIICNPGVKQQNILNQIEQTYKKKIQIIQLALKLSQRAILSFEDKIQAIIKGVPIYITLDQWEQLQKYFYKGKKYSKAQKQIFLQTQQFKEKINLALKQKVPHELLEQCQKHLKFLEITDKQFHLNNSENTWIVKPASMSRGRGIKTFNSLNEIFDYIAGKQVSWVVQKYIERPLIIKKRKFDIRQWIIVTDFKPLRVWIYEQVYVRFCAEVYDPQNLKNRKVHLTNNSVTKGVSDIKDSDYIQQNMWSHHQFQNQISKMTGQPDFLVKRILPQIKQICIQTMKSIRQNIVPRKNTFQLFGYDFMIDEWYRVWLIEVNSSPCMEYSTKVTAKIVQKSLKQMGDLVEKYMMNGKLYKEDYGGWKLACGK